MTNIVKKKLKCVIIQDGTNSILKKIDSTIDEFSSKYAEFIALITANFSPGSIVICEIPPIHNNDDANDKTDHYNRFLNEMYGSTTGFEVLNLNSNIKSLESYQSLYFDTTHLNNELGIPFLRNSLGSYVFKHSSKLPRVKPAHDYTGKANSYQKSLSNYQQKMFIGLPIDPIVTIACTHMADKLVIADKLVKIISTKTHGAVIVILILD